MIAVDTSAMVAYLAGDRGADLQPIDDGLHDGTVVLPPVVLADLLSDPGRSSSLGQMLTGIPTLEILPGYWVRAAATRSTVLSHKIRVRTEHALVCQSCLDHNVALLARDAVFGHFARYAGLKLI